VAVLLTLALAAFVLVSMTALLIGPHFGARIAATLGIKPVAAYVWSVIRWPLMVVCAVTAIDVVYHFAPNRRSRWAWLTPGGMFATASWLVSSTCFKYYVSHFGHYTATYGAIGAAIITMLWFYVSGLALLIGAELNAVIDRRRAERDDIARVSQRA